MANSAIGGSTNAPIHINAIAQHVGVDLSIDDWQRIGHAIPLLVNMQPAGRFLGEAFYRAGGLPAVMHELLGAGKLHAQAITANGRTVGENYRDTPATDREVIRAYDQPLMTNAGFVVLGGNLFDAAIMKTSVISDEFRTRYLERPGDEGAFEGRAIVFEGPEDYHARIDNPALAIDETLHPRGAWLRTGRLSGVGRGGQHAATGLPAKTRHQ